MEVAAAAVEIHQTQQAAALVVERQQMPVRLLEVLAIRQQQVHLKEITVVLTALK